VRVNPVHRVLNKPLTICGCQREHFFLALTLGAAGWAWLSDARGRLALFVVGVRFAAPRHRHDTKLPWILFRARKFKAIATRGGARL